MIERSDLISQISFIRETVRDIVDRKISCRRVRNFLLEYLHDNNETKLIDFRGMINRIAYMYPLIAGIVRIPMWYLKKITPLPRFEGRYYKIGYIERLLALDKACWLARMTEKKLGRTFSWVNDEKSAETLLKLYTIVRYALTSDRLDMSAIQKKKEYYHYLKDGKMYKNNLKFNPLVNSFVYKRLYFYHYQPSPSAVLYDHGITDDDRPRRLPSHFSYIVDVGAFIGDSTVVLSKHLEKDGRILSFEPDKFLFTYLKHTLKLNYLTERVDAYRMYVGTKKEHVKLNEILEKYEEREKNILVKIDVEGSELDVLTSGRKRIKEYKPVIIASIYHFAEDVVNIPKFFITHFGKGYELYLRHPSRPTPFYDYYLIAIPKNKA